MCAAISAARRPARGFTLLCRPATRAGDLGCWLTLPPRMSNTLPPLVAVHGIRRRAEAQAALLAGRAAAQGRPVIAPLFDRENWPRYQQAVRRGRADLALLRLMADLRSEGVWRTRRFDLFGFSGGAQFAHRFAMLHPDAVSRLVTASAGWYTFPDDAVFPYGLAPRPGHRDSWAQRLTGNLDRFLALPIAVCVGSDDNVPDANTRGGAAIDAQQGKHRLARGARWVHALRQTARARGISASVGFHTMPFCGHDFRTCVIRGGLDRIVVPHGPT